MSWLNTILCGACITTASWIGISYATEVMDTSHAVAMYMGEPADESQAPAIDLTEVPDFTELQPMPLRNMLASSTDSSERAWAARRHTQRLADARRANALAEMRPPATAARSRKATTDVERRRDLDRAHRLNTRRAQKKYDRRMTTVFERTRHYKDNRYSYEHSTSSRRSNSRMNGRRGLRVPISTSRRR